MWLRSISVSLNGYGSKIRNINRCRPAMSNETILATRQEFFFTKVAPVQSMTEMVLLNFWLILLSWTFSSSYTTIYFFAKKFIFSNVYISVSTIFECVYMFFWLGKGWEIDKATFYFMIFLVKIWSENSISYTSWNYLLLNMTVW